MRQAPPTALCAPPVSSVPPGRAPLTVLRSPGTCPPLLPGAPSPGVCRCQRSLAHLSCSPSSLSVPVSPSLSWEVLPDSETFSPCGTHPMVHRELAASLPSYTVNFPGDADRVCLINLESHGAVSCLACSFYGISIHLITHCLGHSLSM